MRTRILAVTALVTLSSVLSGQIGRRPPIGDPGRTPARPGEARPGEAPLPKEAPEVSRVLSLKRARWSTEGYSMMNAVRTPTGAGGIVTSTSWGAGTHADYRVADHFSMSLDGTYSPLGYSGTSSTFEVGSRYSPFSFEHKSRPFFDVRAGYLFLLDRQRLANPANPQTGYIETTRNSRGFGGLVGTGLEYSLTGSLALVTEISAMRNRMSQTQSDGPATIGSQSHFWMTAYRATIGLKYNPVRALQFAQNARQ